MRTGHLLFSAVHFFMVFLVIALGVVFLTLPYADVFRMELIQLLDHPSETSLWLGGGIVGIGILLFIAAYMLSRRQYVQIEMGGSPVTINEKVIRRCTQEYFKERFPDFAPLSDVVIKGKSTIEIITSLPKPQEEEFFEEVEEELSSLLARRLGYIAPFTVTFVES